MTTQPLFFLLNQHMGWHNDSANQVSIGSELALTARPDGPLALNNSDGSLGHLTLPRGVALASDGTVFLIPTDDHTQVLRYDVEENAFVSIPGVGEAGKDARNFDAARNLAIAGYDGGQLLYVADTGNDRVQVFHLASLALLHIFSLPHWSPVDVAAWGDWAYILDAEKQRVYRHNVSGERLELVCEATFPARWRRIALDREGRIYLLNKYDPVNLSLNVFTPEQPRGVDRNPSSDPWEHFTDAGNVYDHFDTPAVIVQSDPRQASPYHGGIFQLKAHGCESE